MNKITLLGRLTKDVELKMIGDRPLAEFSLAVDRKYKNAQGERETDFFNCKLWGKTAETLQQYTMKGQRLLVAGHVENRTFVNQEGQNVRFTEVIVEEFDFVEKSPNNGFSQGGFNQNGFNQNQGGYNQGGFNNNQGFNTVNANGNASGYFNNQNQGGFNQNQGFNNFNGFKTGATNPNNGFNQNQGGFNNVQNVNEDDLPF